MTTTLAVTRTVADHDAWYAAFTEHAASRTEHGSLSEKLFGFLARPSLHEAGSRAGVLGQPRFEIWTTVQTVEF